MITNIILMFFSQHVKKWYFPHHIIIFITIELPFAFLLFDSLYLGILGFKSDSNLHSGFLHI